MSRANSSPLWTTPQLPEPFWLTGNQVLGRQSLARPHQQCAIEKVRWGEKRSVTSRFTIVVNHEGASSTSHHYEKWLRYRNGTR